MKHIKQKKPYDEAKRNDTIVAQATPAGRGGIGVIRISSPEVKKIAESLLGHLPKPRYARFSAIRRKDHQLLDEGLSIYFPAPFSFTGEDILEIQVHGSPLVIDEILVETLQLGARLAKPGEFSERAFLNNKIDLTQAEAIADLIHASSHQAMQAALRSLQGDFSKQIEQLIQTLLQLRILVEAAIDFPEEEIDFLSELQVEDKVANIIQAINLILETAKQGALLREGLNIVIAGEPNVGKSSLLNYLVGKESAIVTEIPGTTRDILREYIQIEGLPLHIVDTAGLRETDDIVEKEGIIRAQHEIKKADLIVFLVDALKQKNIDAETLKHFFNKTSTDAPMVIIRNKIDLLSETANQIEVDGKTIISLSIKKSMGINLLKEYIKNFAGLKKNEEGVFMARRRHIDALVRAKKELENGMEQLQEQHAGELLAEDLRSAQQTLSEITGEVISSDDLLGEIFSSFCIGK